VARVIDPRVFVSRTLEVFMFGRIIVLAALLTAPTLVYADNIAADAGPLELTVDGNGTNDHDFSGGGFTVDGSVGFMVLPVLELSVRDGVSYDDFKMGHAWDNTVRGAVDFELPLDRFEPYVGANVGYFASDRFGSSPEAAPEVGLKFFFTKSAFLFAQAEYDFYWRNTGNDFRNGTFNYALGIGIRL
jgi:hypothetical protein